MYQNMSGENKRIDLYAPIVQKIEYWRDYAGNSDSYRQKHDLDCILTDGNLLADSIFSLWLPLRYTLDYYNCSAWKMWKEYERKELKPNKRRLKKCPEFLNRFIDNIEDYLPSTEELTGRISNLFCLGQQRCNVMILPYRSWNNRRGCHPYYDYFPHFLYDLLSTDSSLFLDAIRGWIQQENLQMFFKEEIINKDHIKDLAGTGAPYRHTPAKINLKKLINNYIEILEKRELFISKFNDS